MILLPISKGTWSVYAVCEDEDTCNVMDTLESLGTGNKDQKSLAKKMLHLLREWISAQPQGPQTSNENISEHLSGDVYEFKKGKKRGPKIRVLYFYGDGKEVICSVCVVKKEEKIDKKYIDQTDKLCEQFKKDLAADEITRIGE